MAVAETPPLPGGPAPGGPVPDRAPASERVPTVVVDDLHVVYRVWGAAKQAKGGAPAALARVLRGRPSPVRREVHAIRGVTFSAYRGDAIGLVGRNGSGKSTLLRAVAGLLPANAGAVYTASQPSLLGVNAALIPDLTGERNIVLGCLAMGLTRAQTAEVFDSIVEFSGIGDFVSLPMRTYSSGMSARLRFAIGASVTHDVLLIDEALATGDREFQRRSEGRIRELRDEAGTVFLVSHSHGIVRQTCNRAIWLDKGQVLMDGEADEVVDAYEASAR